MKRLLTLALIIATTITIPVLAADVGVPINIGQPGFMVDSTLATFRSHS